MTDIDECALRSVATQFRGGEHALAGKRASQLVYGKAKKPNQKLLDALVAEVPGIERYISADGITPPAGDQGGNPLATQPENDPEQNNASNVSDIDAKGEQNEIDDRLEKGRDRQEETADGEGEVGETQLNPEGSDTGADKTTGTTRGRRKPA